MGQKHIFVMAMDDFNHAMLERLRGARQMRFFPLLDLTSAVDTRHYDIPGLFRQARTTLQQFSSTVDAIVGYWDFPTCTMLPVLQREFSLPGPSLESVLRCEHKYWARTLEAEVAPRETPRFAAVDPFKKQTTRTPPLPYPFWLKPIRAHSSQLGFRVEDKQDFTAALEQIRNGIHLFGKPFNYFLDLAQLPADIRAIDGWHCIAEEIISAGRQCTVEGYVLHGEVHIYGVVDSLREGKVNSSFSRYQYPSTFPREIRDAMYHDCRRFLHRAGYDNAPFNIEFFYDDETGKLWMLEVNTRCSKSHSPLFEMVDGASNLQAMVDVALGRQPDFPPEGGDFRYAAKFMLREHHDALVEQVPSPADIHAVEQAVPGCRIQVEAVPNQRLSQLLHQDSYSFEYATLFIGGDSKADIEEKAEQVKRRLNFRFTR